MGLVIRFDGTTKLSCRPNRTVRNDHPLRWRDTDTMLGKVIKDGIPGVTLLQEMRHTSEARADNVRVLILSGPLVEGDTRVLQDLGYAHGHQQGAGLWAMGVDNVTEAPRNDSH